MFRTATRIAASLTLLMAAGTPLVAQEEARAVAGGGITAPGWMGKVDANEAARGQVITNSRFAAQAGGYRVTTGPAAVYWHPNNRATGNYTVRATFTEPEYMNVNDHPHPYGIVIGGNNMGTDNQSYLYCAAYGNGTFIVRGFGPAAFQVNGRRGEANPAVRLATSRRRMAPETVSMETAVKTR